MSIFEKSCFQGFPYNFTSYFPMQNVYLPTQMIFLLYKVLYINM